MKVTEIALKDIEVGERRRQDLGDIAALAQGMKKVGLLEPIIVDREKRGGVYRLIAGERRLRAAQMLKWKVIPVHLKEHLTDEEFREIELIENEDRKSLTGGERRRSFETAKRIVEAAKKVAKVIAESKPPKVAGPARNKGGRPSKLEAPAEEIAKDLGIDARTLRRAERHVETAERYPFMKGRGWREANVLAFREALDKFEADERPALVAALEQVIDSTYPADKVAAMARNMAGKSKAEREDVYRMAADSTLKSAALVKMAEAPPPPPVEQGLSVRDTDYPWTRREGLKHVVQVLKELAKPDDEVSGRIRLIVAELIAIRNELKDAKKKPAPEAVSEEATAAAGVQ